MGFLDHSTNNIIIDAVLTDVGRQALSRNDGSFGVYQFALGDDEVDYSLVQKYGRTVGREKIEKNTPVMEALTSSNLALKHKLRSFNNPHLTHLPNLVIDNLPDVNNSNIFNMSIVNRSVLDINFKISNSTQEPIEDDVADGLVRVELDSTFLRLNNASIQLLRPDNSAVYIIPAAAAGRGADGSIKFTTSLNSKKFSLTTFNNFSVANKSYIRSFVKVTGVNSGLTKIVEIRIYNKQITI